MVVAACSEWCAAPSPRCRVSLGRSSGGVPTRPCRPRILVSPGWQLCWSSRSANGSCGSWGFCICVRSALRTAVWAGCRDCSAPAPCPQLPLEGCPWMSSRSVADGCCRSRHWHSLLTNTQIHNMMGVFFGQFLFVSHCSWHRRCRETLTSAPIEPEHPNLQCQSLLFYTNFRPSEWCWWAAYLSFTAATAVNSTISAGRLTQGLTWLSVHCTVASHHHHAPTHLCFDCSWLSPVPSLIS